MTIRQIYLFTGLYTVRFAGGAVLELARGFNPEETASLCRVLGRL